MNGTDASALLQRVVARDGHFRLESGYHSALWLDLNPLFSRPDRIEPFVNDLARRIAPYDVAAVCGPLVGGAFLAQWLARALSVEFYFTARANPSPADGLYSARYLLPSGFRDRVQGGRIAIVDDVMSAGSALRSTFTALRDCGAECVVAGALLVLGTRGNDFFTAHGVAVQAVTRRDFQLWSPADCPLCASGLPLEQVADDTPLSGTESSRPGSLERQ